MIIINDKNINNIIKIKTQQFFKKIKSKKKNYKKYFKDN